VIPTLLVVGLLAGRWYAVPLAVVAWPLILVLVGVTTDPLSLAGGAGLAAINTAVGVAVHKVVVCLVRHGVRAARSCRSRLPAG
jgi:hypothetical protein